MPLQLCQKYSNNINKISCVSLDENSQNVYDDGNANKLLGYSDNIQGEMELECELVTNGLYCGNASGYTDPKRKMLEPNAKKWRLLLQIDSNEENGMMWGDCVWATLLQYC